MAPHSCMCMQLPPAQSFYEQRYPNLFFLCYSNLFFRAHTDKENICNNIQQYIFMSFQTGVFRMTMPLVSATCFKKFNSMNIFNVSAILLQNMTQNARATFWFHNRCTWKTCCVVWACKIVAHVAAALKADFHFDCKSKRCNSSKHTALIIPN